jgi:hypothetical protein
MTERKRKTRSKACLSANLSTTNRVFTALTANPDTSRNRQSTEIWYGQCAPDTRVCVLQKAPTFVNSGSINTNGIIDCSRMYRPPQSWQMA